MVDIVYMTADGTHRRDRKIPEGVTSKSAAERWGGDRLRHLQLTGGATPDVPTVAAFWPRFLENYVRANRQKPSTIVSKESIWKHHLEPVLADKRLDAITNEDVQSLKKRTEHHSPKTTNNVLTVLGKMLRTAVDWDVIEAMPCKVKLLKAQPPEMHFYERAELDRLIEAAAKVDRRAEIVVLLGAEAGLRAGEIVALEWRDVDLVRGALTVCRAEWRGAVSSPKSGKSRRVPLTETLRDRLSAHRSLRGERVICEAGKPVAAWQLRDWMERAQRLAGISTGEVFHGKRRGERDRGRLHVLRHTFCSHLVMAGVTVTAVQKLAGHASIATTMRYLHVAKGSDEAAIAALDAAKRTGNVASTDGKKAAST